MPNYVFRLHDGPTVAPTSENVAAADDQEARDLAQLRLTLSSAFTHVDVYHAGREVVRLKRDSQKPI